MGIVPASSTKQKSEHFQGVQFIFKLKKISDFSF